MSKKGKATDNQELNNRFQVQSKDGLRPLAAGPRACTRQAAPAGSRLHLHALYFWGLEIEDKTRALSLLLDYIAGRAPQPASGGFLRT